MIGRLWHGWTSRENADGAHRGNLPVPPSPLHWSALRADRPLRGRDSMEAIRAFAGEDVERAVILLEAYELLDRFDERVAHFEIRAEP